MAKLTDDEIRTALGEIEGWTSVGDAIRKDFVFPGFRGAIGFVNRVADRANEAAHHPDLEIHYNRVRVSLSTHDQGGVTEKDVALAAAIDAVVAPDEG
jgi:4a-hydroxytetrahydrobiopterin dehydratase